MKKRLLLTLIFACSFATTPCVWSQSKKAGVSTSKFAFQSLPLNIKGMVQSPTDVYFLQAGYLSNLHNIFVLNKATGKLRTLIADTPTGPDRPNIFAIAWHPTLGLLFFVDEKGLYAYNGKSIETSTLLYEYDTWLDQIGHDLKLYIAPDSSIISCGHNTAILEPDGKTLRLHLRMGDKVVGPLGNGRYAVDFGSAVPIYQGTKMIARYSTCMGSKPNPPYEIFDNLINNIAASLDGNKLYAYNARSVYMLETGSTEFKLVKQLDYTYKWSFCSLTPLADGGFRVVPSSYDKAANFIFLDKDFSGDKIGREAILSEVINTDVLGLPEPFSFRLNGGYANEAGPIIDQYGNQYVLHAARSYPAITQLYVYNPDGIHGLEAIRGRYVKYVAPEAAE